MPKKPSGASHPRIGLPCAMPPSTRNSVTALAMKFALRSPRHTSPRHTANEQVQSSGSAAHAPPSPLASASAPTTSPPTTSRSLLPDPPAPRLLTRADATGLTTSAPTTTRRQSNFQSAVRTVKAACDSTAGFAKVACDTTLSGAATTLSSAARSVKSVQDAAGLTAAADWTKSKLSEGLDDYQLGDLKKKAFGKTSSLTSSLTKRARSRGRRGAAAGHDGGGTWSRLVEPEEKPTFFRTAEERAREREYIIDEDQWSSCPKFLWFPVSQSKQAWDFGVMIIVLYVCVLLPYRIAFEGAVGMRFVFETALQLLLLLDVAACFFVPLLQNGRWIVHQVCDLRRWSPQNARRDLPPISLFQRGPPPPCPTFSIIIVPLLTPSHRCSRHLTPAHAISPLLTPSHRCSRHLTPAHAISPLLTPCTSLRSPTPT